MQRHVFISHSAKDAAVARRIADALRAAGARTWMAPDDIDPGADWGAAIATAIADCAAMILVLTAHSNASKQVVREVQLADAANHPIIPLRMEALELSPSLKYFLSASQWLDATRLGEEEMLRDVVATVRARAPAAVVPEASRVEPAPPKPEPVAPAAPVGAGSTRPTSALPRAVWAAAAVAGLGAIYIAAQTFNGDQAADDGFRDADTISATPLGSPAGDSANAALGYRPDAGSPPWLRFAWEEQGMMEHGANYRQSRVYEYMQAVMGDSAPADPNIGWSAAFVNWALGRAGYRGTGSYAGRSFLEWGMPALGLQEGCIIVMRRGTNPAGGHAGFFLFQRGDSAYVLSGNVGNRVAVSAFAMERVLECRFPMGYRPPAR